jgi:signal transduction histidine kinase
VLAGRRHPRHHGTPPDGRRAARRQGKRRAGRRRARQLRGQHEPRDPHADECDPRLHRRAAGRRTATEQRRHLDTIRSSGRALLRLLNEILDTAKLEKGAVELEQNDYNLLSLIDELSSTLAANARAKGLHVDIHYDPALPTCLRGDELRVRQVLTNLLDNAIKFTEKGSVTLRADCRTNSCTS